MRESPNISGKIHVFCGDHVKKKKAGQSMRPKDDLFVCVQGWSLKGREGEGGLR